MSLLKGALPPVSREFALELKKRFRPLEVKPGFDRDALMQSVGEQRVIAFILFHSNHKIITSDINKDNTDKDSIDINKDIVYTDNTNIIYKESFIKRLLRIFRK